MRGINNRPFISLDTYLPIEKLRSCHDSLCYGIARASFRDGVYGAKNLLRSDVECISKHSRYLKKHPEDPRNRLYRKLPDAQSRLRFLKLMTGAQSLGQSVDIKICENYKEKHLESGCRDHPNRQFFSDLIELIDTFPLQEYGRVVIFVSDSHAVGHTHRDHPSERPNTDEFIWLTTRRDKRFYVYDEETEAKHYIESYAAFFNNNDYHGYDPTPGATFSIRVDGVFTDELRQRIGIGGLESW